MKLWERIVEARLRGEVMNCEQQYGFMPGKSTTDAMFALRVLLEKYREDQKELHCVFVDLEKAYDRVPREELWYCMRKSSVAEKYVRVVQDMFEDSVTAVRCAVGRTDCTVTRSRCGEGGWVKYLGSVVQMNGECGREVKKSVQAVQECQEWFVIEEYLQEWKVTFTRLLLDDQLCCMVWRCWHWQKDRRRSRRWQS